MNNVLNKIKGTVVVSVQAMPSEPLYLEKCMAAMMKSVVTGGAGALRVAGARDVRNAKRLFSVPVIGLTKPNIIPKNWKEIVYITPTLKDVIELIEAGADIIFKRTFFKKSSADNKDFSRSNWRIFYFIFL